MAFGLLDISIVTDRLISVLNTAIGATHLWLEEPVDPDGTPIGATPGAAFNINVTGLAPDSARKQPGCQLSLYLFHVVPDKFQRNSPVTGPRWPPANTGNVPPVRFQPLSLDLYYLLTAYSENSYIQEQQAMSIALKAFHENPRIIATVPVAPPRSEEFCLTMEIESADELSRVWQAATVSMRLSVVYRISVVFLEPPPLPPPAPPVQHVSLSTDAAALDPVPVVTGTHFSFIYFGPEKALQPDQDIKQVEMLPAVVGPGQTFELNGIGLGTPNNANTQLLFDGGVEQRIYLLRADGTESDVTSWATITQSGASRVVLTVPAVGAPAAGIYQLRVGNNKPSGDPVAFRSNATPFSIGPVVTPGANPILNGAVIAFTGQGFDPATTEVFLSNRRLTRTAGALSAGLFTVGAAAIQLMPPADLPSGLYAVRVRVNGVEAPAVHWIQVP